MHDDITIELGEGEYLAIQMMNLGSILDGLEGMSGTLYMKDFDSDKATASFSKN
jgi:cell division protein FtsQ